MVLRWLKAVLALPFTVLVLIPGLILFLSWNARVSLAGPGTLRFWLALLLAVMGLVLAAWTVGLFARFGQGTAAPWDPPQRFVVRGPYRHVRNPMILGAFLVLLAEALLFGSWFVFAWFGLFVLGNLLYIPLVEEKGLEERFGDAYKDYTRHVPRWLPRLRPWRQG